MVTNGNRFIERDYHKVKEWVQMGHIEPRHVPGVDNPADLFTKHIESAPRLDKLMRMFNCEVVGGRPAASLASAATQTNQTSKHGWLCGAGDGCGCRGCQGYHPHLPY